MQGGPSVAAQQLAWVPPDVLVPAPVRTSRRALRQPHYHPKPCPIQPYFPHLHQNGNSHPQHVGQGRGQHLATCAAAVAFPTDAPELRPPSLTTPVAMPAALGWEAFGTDDDDYDDDDGEVPVTAGSVQAPVALPDPTHTTPLPRPQRPTSPPTAPTPAQRLSPSVLPLNPTTAPAAPAQPTAHPYILAPAHLPRPAAGPPLLTPKPPSVPSAATAAPTLQRPTATGPSGPELLPPGPRLVPQPPRPKAKRPRVTDFTNDDAAARAYDGLPVRVAVVAGGAGEPAPEPLNSFNRLRSQPYCFNRRLQHTMVQLRYNAPTPVQQHAMAVIARGRDVCATSPTGSGKTGAYLLPLLNMLIKRSRDGGPANTAYPVAVVLAPTRELVAQVYEEVSRFIKGMHLKAVALHGGDSMVNQVLALRHGCDLVVATPGRLLDHVHRRGSVHLGQVAMVVVDEADKMMGLGFEPELRRLFTHVELPPSRQAVFMSTSLPPELAAVAEAFMRPDAVMLAVGHETGAAHLVTHRVLPVARPDKPAALAQLLSAPLSGGGAGGGAGVEGALPEGGLTIVFTNSMEEAKKVHSYVASQLGLGASLLHSGLPQASRDEAVQCFRYGVTPVLVTTNLAARGMDVPDTAQVINYDMPWTVPDYVHRCGRTGRGGRAGVATSLFSPEDAHVAGGVVKVIRSVGQEAPAWLADLGQQATQRPSSALDSMADDEETDEFAPGEAAASGHTGVIDRGSAGGAADQGRYVHRAAVAQLRARRASAFPWSDLVTPRTKPVRVGGGAHAGGLTHRATGRPAGADGNLAPENTTATTALPSDEVLLQQWEAAIMSLGRGGARRARPGAQGRRGPQRRAR